MSIYQHYRKHEHAFVDQVLQIKEKVEQSYTHYLSDFLDPREQQIVASLIGTQQDDIHYGFCGGNDTTERKRAVIAPFYEEITQDTFEIVLLEAAYPEKFVRLEHPDILGAFMSLGIDRKKIGDIIVLEDRFQFLLVKDLAGFVQMNLTGVKQATIRLQEKRLTALGKHETEWIEKSHTVSSLRLDIITKEMYGLSRKVAVDLINAKRVKVNFTEVTDPAVPLLENDLISIRGYGRGKLVEIGGTTRKDKIRITTARMKV